MPARLHRLALPVLAALSLAGCAGQSTTTAPSPSARNAISLRRAPERYDQRQRRSEAHPSVVAPALRHRHDRRAARAHHRAAGRGRPGPLSAARRPPPGGHGHVRGRGQPGERRPGRRRAPRRSRSACFSTAATTARGQRRTRPPTATCGPARCRSNGRRRTSRSPTRRRSSSTAARTSSPSTSPRSTTPQAATSASSTPSPPTSRCAADLQCRLVGPAHHRPERR